AEPIADAIYKRLGRTVTISSARGLVSGKKEMLYVVITRLELPELREIVEASDESAFITISDVNEIIGKHVRKVDEAVVEELEA
ncbi:MAG: YitT family protein, partial [Clostridia bacterium]|nr:YitT family protein [Clostridia bacterium]